MSRAPSSAAVTSQWLGAGAEGATALACEDAVARLLRNHGARYDAHTPTYRRSFARRRILIVLPPLERWSLREALVVESGARPAVAGAKRWLVLDEDHAVWLLPNRAHEESRAFDTVLLLGVVERAFGSRERVASALTRASRYVRDGGVILGVTLNGGVLERRYDGALRRRGDARGALAWALDRPVGSQREREEVLCLIFEEWPSDSPYGRALRACWGSAACERSAEAQHAVSRDELWDVAHSVGLRGAVDFHGLCVSLVWNNQHYWRRSGERVGAARFAAGISDQEWAACNAFAVFAFEIGS